MARPGYGPNGIYDPAQGPITWSEVQAPPRLKVNPEKNFPGCVALGYSEVPALLEIEQEVWRTNDFGGTE